MGCAMFKNCFLALIACLPMTALAAPDCFPEEVLPELYFPAVKLETSMGEIVVELNRMRAPAAVNNFLRYALDGHYDNTIFHRVMPDFVVQGGGYSEDFSERPLRDPIINESGNGLANMKMTVAMARFDDPHSATSQFFFNLNDNEALNPSSKHWGYTVFGEVVSGQDVIKAISAVETGYSEGLDAEDVPVSPVMLIKASIQE
jgi:peptidyl-prolyl cis-trans isomerase A (cyclophilin A)